MVNLGDWQSIKLRDYSIVSADLPTRETVHIDTKSWDILMKSWTKLCEEGTAYCYYTCAIST